MHLEDPRPPVPGMSLGGIESTFYLGSRQGEDEWATMKCVGGRGRGGGVYYSGADAARRDDGTAICDATGRCRQASWRVTGGGRIGDGYGEAADGSAGSSPEGGVISGSYSKFVRQSTV